MQKVTDTVYAHDSEDEIAYLAKSAVSGMPTIKTTAKSQTEVERGSFMVLCKDDISWVKVSFVEDSGYQIMRIGIEGRDSLDLVLNRNHMRAILDQTTLWITG